MDTYLVSVLNGLSMGSLLFAIALGLSLVFGMMDVLNLAHGAVYLAGAYVAVALVGDGAGLPAFVLAVL
ncbi:branched-chain amino acid ABC transporter permease, partial [Actinomadura adrarensis]